MRFLSELAVFAVIAGVAFAIVFGIAWAVGSRFGLGTVARQPYLPGWFCASGFPLSPTSTSPLTAVATSHVENARVRVPDRRRRIDERSLERHPVT